MGDGIIFPSGGYIIGNLGSGSVTVSGAGTIVSQIGGNIGSGSMVVKAGMMDYKSATYGDFNGTSTYVNIASDSSLDEPKTIAFWCKPDQIKSGANNVVSRGSNDYEIYFHSSTNTWWNYWGTKYSTGADGPPVGVGVWQHIVCTLDDTTSPPTVRWYKDGILFNTDQLNGTPSYGDDGALNIGRDASEENDWMDGAIREVSLYNTKLTDSQVELLYKNQYVGSPVGLWKLDEGTGTEIVDKGSGGNNGVFTNGSWENPAIKNLCTSGSTTFEVKSGASGSLPRGTFTQARNVNFPGTILHNSGTISFAPIATSIAIYAGGNSFYNVHRVEGDNEWVRQYENMTVLKRLYLNDYVGWGVHNASTLTLGDDTTQCTVDGDQPLQVTAANGKIYGGHETNPAIINNTGGGLTFGANTNLKWLDIRTDELTGGGGVTITQDGDMQYSKLNVESGDTYDMTGQRAEFSGNLDMESGVTFVGSGALLVCDDKIKTDGATVYNSGTSVICSHAGTSTVRFNDGDWENFMYNPTGGGVSFDTNANVANNLMIAGGYYDMTTTHLSGDGVGKLQIAGGAEFRGGDGTTHEITDTFNMGGGLIGTSALEFNGSSESAANASATTWGFGSSFSIELWFKTSFNGSSCLLDMAESSGNDNRIQILQTASEMAFKLWNSGGSSFQIGTTAFTINPDDGKWHHLAFTSNGSTQKIYYDGRLAGEASHTITRDADPTMKLTIGMHSTLGSHYSGFMDELRFFSNARTEAKIRKDMFQGGTLDDSTNLVARYHFDEGYDTTLASTVGATARNLVASGDGVWIAPGTFTYETCTLKFDKAGTCYLSGSQDGNATNMYSVHITNGTTVEASCRQNDLIMNSGSLMTNSGTLNSNRNWQYKSRNMPIVGASSDLVVGNNIWYYMGDGSGLPVSGAGTNYSQLRPATNVYMQGDFDCANDLLQSGGDLHLNGYKCTTTEIHNYGGGNIWAEPGSSIEFDTTGGFNKMYGASPTTMTFVASGEACVQFYGDDNDGYGNYITLPKTTALDFGNSAFTMTYWAKIGDNADEEYIISNMNSSDSAWPGYRFGLKHGDLNNQISDNSGGGGEKRFDTNISTGTWKHIAIVVSGTGGDMVCYVDGSIPVAGQSLGTYASLNNDKTVKIGGAYAGDTQSFNGSLADIRFYKSALSAANITTLSSENSAISVSGAYADPDNALSATVWLKLGMTPSGTMDLKNYGTSGSANDGTWVTSGSPPRLGKSGIVTISSSATPYEPINRIYPAGVTLINTYMSGSKDIIVGQTYESTAGITAHTAQFVKTKGTVVLD